MLIREWKPGRGLRQYLPLTDGLGNICGLIDATDGSLVAEFDYDPYGNPVIESLTHSRTNELTNFSTTCPFRHRTRYYDSESWLYYYGYRYYDPSTTKWISKDPIGEAGGWNLTCFCNNDPVNGFDPLGLDPYSVINEWATASVPLATFFPPPPAPKRLPPQNDLSFVAAGPKRAEPPRHTLSAGRNGMEDYMYSQATCGVYPMDSGMGKIAVESQYRAISILLGGQFPATMLIYSAPDVQTVFDSDASSGDKTVAGLKIAANVGLYSLGRYMEGKGKALPENLAPASGSGVNSPSFSASAGAATKQIVTLDANALMRGLEKGELAAVDAAIAGRMPTISITAAKEFLKKGDVNVLREFVTARGGRIGQAATAQQIANLQAQAQVLGRVLKAKDASVVGSAVNEGATIVTRDIRLQNFLKAVGLPVEGF